jgi:hypothetical protein
MYQMNDRRRNRLLQACYSFLVPVARFLLINGISHREFSELCRVAFVDVATHEFGIRGRRTNNSRVSAMTGIGRKDVSRVRDLAKEYQNDPRVRLSPLSDVLHHWHTDDDYRNPDGSPKALPISGIHSSFESLVRRCVGDRPAGAIKAELLRHKTVTLNDDGLLEVNRREVVPDHFDEKLITSLAFNFRGLAETIAHNSNPDRTEPGRIERYVESEVVSDVSKQNLRRILRTRITSFTEELDDMFSSYERAEDGAGERVAVGIYYHEDTEKH